jgi:hypothetical protein
MDLQIASCIIGHGPETLMFLYFMFIIGCKLASGKWPRVDQHAREMKSFRANSALWRSRALVRAFPCAREPPPADLALYMWDA